MTTLSRNIMLLMWEKKRDYPNQSPTFFISKFAKQCKIERDRLIEIMKGISTPSDYELNSILACCPNSEYAKLYIKKDDMVEFMDVCERELLVKDNTMYLLEGLGQGETQIFIEKINVNPSTVTRWKQGKTAPNRSCQEKIAGYFGLTPSTVLRDCFICFNLGPWPVQMRKKEYMRRIQEMDNEEFEKLEYALSKIL